MTLKAASFILLAAVAATAGPRLREPEEHFPALLVGGHEGLGNACPVGVFALTAGHVADIHDLQWRIGSEGGPVEVVRRHKEDLAAIRLLRPDGGLYIAQPARRVADEAPRSGEQLRALVTLSDGERVVIYLRALSVDEAGDLLLDGLSFPGVSGSCVVDERGDLVGVFAGTSVSGNTRPLGYLVPVWGRKLP